MKVYQPTSNKTQRYKSSANALNNSIQTMKILLNKNEKHVLNVNDSISWNREKEKEKKKSLLERESSQILFS